jgi:hypothetical protein
VRQVWLRDGPIETAFTANTAATVTLLLEPAGTDRWLSLTLAAVREGSSARYLTTVEGCPDGCRLIGLALNLSDLEVDEVEITWHGLRRDGAALAPDVFADSQRWRAAYNGPIHRVDLIGGDDGLTLDIPTTAGLYTYRILINDAPLPVPVVTGAAGVGGAGGRGAEMPGMDGIPVRIAPAAAVAGVPWLSGEQILVDLRYAALSAEPTGRSAAPQVWLAADTPDRIVRELEAAGLVVLSDRSLPDVQALLDRSGPAVALRFQLLAAGLAALLGIGALGLVAAVDRRGWGMSLQALRTQGVARRTVRAATLWAYGWVVVVAAVIGAGAAAAAWWAAGDRLPMVVGEPVPVPTWPRWEPVATGWLAAAVALVVAALGAAWWLSRQIAGGVVPRQRREGR